MNKYQNTHEAELNTLDVEGPYMRLFCGENQLEAALAAREWLEDHKDTHAFIDLIVRPLDGDGWSYDWTQVTGGEEWFYTVVEG